MGKLRSLPFLALACALVYASALVAQQAAVPAVRIVNAIDETRLVTLHGTVHPLANSANDRGAAPDNMQLDRLHLVLKRSPDQEAALRQFIAGTHASGSPSYHKWLTPDAFGRQFGPSDKDIATVEKWLEGHGFSIVQMNPGKQTIEISGTVAQFRSAFHAQIHKYEVNGETHYANASDPSIPAALAPVVGGFVSLNNFRLKSYLQKLGEASYNPSTGRAKPSWTIGGGPFDYQNYNFVLSPADYAVQYDIQKLYNNGIKGDGETIAIVNESNINVYLVNQFRSLFGLPANPPQVIIDGNDPGIDGIDNPDGPNYASVEAYLDVEWSGAVAPDATVDLVIAGDTPLSSGLWLAAEHAVYANVAPIISLSFGGCEQHQGATNQTINALWEQAAAQGQTVLVSTGDNGSAGCDNDNTQDYALNGQAVNGLASTPWNVAVGGTDFYYSDWSGTVAQIDSQLSQYWSTTASDTTPTLTIKGVVPEQPWNNSQFGDDLFSIWAESKENDTTIAGGSGGASNCALGTGYGYGGWLTCTAGWDKPSWQSPTTISSIPNDGVRDLPDVSLFAANGINDSYYPICATDGDCTQVDDGNIHIFGVGGTSASTPSFAGIMALVDQSMASGSNPDGRQGQADYILYPLYVQFQTGSTPPFNDVTNGTNSVPCEYNGGGSPDCIQIPANSSLYDTVGGIYEGQIGNTTTSTAEYNAGTGYDMASGLGTIDAYNLVTDWTKVSLAASNTTLNSLATPISLGTSVSISGTVAGNTSYPPTGSVALMTDSAEPLQQGQAVFTLNSGSYSGTFSNLPGGIYHIWTYYSGDSNNAPSSSTPVEITVGTGSSAIDFNIFSPLSTNWSWYAQNDVFAAGTAISSSVDYGTQLELSAYITPTGADATAFESCLTSSQGTGCSPLPTYPIPTGAVTFADNGSTIDSAILNAAGEAAYNPAFGIGTHSIAASYSGDQSYSSSNTNSSPITFTVAKDLPYINIQESSYDSYYNAALVGPTQPAALTFIVENGAQQHFASYSQTKSTYPVSVAAPTGTVTISNSALCGSTCTVTLTPGVDPTNNAVAGVATFTIPTTTGTGNQITNYTYTYTYNGDSNYASGSEGNNLSILNIGSSHESTTAATLSATSTSPTATVNLSGTVTGQGSTAPTGRIGVYSSGLYIAGANLTAPKTGDVASFSILLNSESLLQGSNFITVQYLGDSNYNPSAVTLGTAVSNPLSDFTLQPASSLVSIDGIATGSDTLNLISMNGFSGTVTLACKATSPLTCSAAGNPTLSNTGSASEALTINLNSAGDGTYNVLVTGTSGSFIHTAAIKVVASNIPEGISVANSSDIAVTGGATTGNTSTITVSPTGGFTGTVDLTCSVTTTLTNPTSPVTCGIPSSVTITGTTAQTATLTATSTSSTTPGSYVITVTAQSGSITQNTTANVAVNVTLPLAAGTPTPSSVSPGGSSTSTITASTSGAGYSGAVTLACSVSPSNLTDPPGCKLSNTTITYTNGTPSPTSVTASVSTIAASSADLVYPGPGAGKGWMGAGGGAVLAVLIFLWIPARRRNWRSLLGLLVLMTALGSLSACGGGGGGGGGGGNSGTTAGSYTFTVTGSGANVSSSTTTTFTVTVN